MTHLNRVMPTIWALFLLLVASVAFAQSNSADALGRLFGLGQPHSVNDLPPGQLKSTLKELSPKAQAKALGWLQRFSFPPEDLTYIRVDSKGSVLYADTAAAAPASEAISVTAAECHEHLEHQHDGRDGHGRIR